MKAKIRLVVAEDHEMVAQGFRAMLSRHCEILEVVRDGREVIECVRRHRPDVVLLDLSLPHRTGVDILTDLAKTMPEVKVVVVTMHVDPILVDATLGLGACAFVPKDAGVEELKAAINEAVAGRRYVSRRARRRGPRGQAVDRMGFSQLTPRQQEIVRMIGRGLKGEEIAEQLGLTLHTIRFHRKNIARQLGLEGEWEMLRYAMLVSMADDSAAKN
ncbi:MAG TPA: response regulator transcription factor [bacterium]|nr:response regulator transcription factor [bacterium]